MSGKITLQSLADYTWTAINSDYMLGILVTSQAEARIKGEGWSFGAGKTSFVLQYAKQFCYGGDWEAVCKHLISFAHELKPFVQPGAKRTPAVIIDDMQLDFGKHKSSDPDLKELCYYLTVQRPNLGVILGTTSHRGMLSKDFREEIFHFEVIVPKRGLFEIQQLKRWIPFDDPLRVRERLEPFGVGPFLSLEPEEQAWYDEWRTRRDLKAMERLRLLKQPGEEEEMRLPSLMNFHEFELYFHKVLGLKAEATRLWRLWKVYRREEDPWPQLRAWV